MKNLQKYNKAIVAFVVLLVVAGLKHFNLSVDQNFQDALSIVIGTGLVWFVPNKK